MRFSVNEQCRRNLMRGAALVFAGGVLAGCSSGSSRFGGGVDDIFTGSTDNQRQIIRKAPVNQPFPGDIAAAQPASQLSPAPHASVQRSALAPAPGSLATAPVAQAPALDTMPTGTTPPPAAVAQRPAPQPTQQPQLGAPPRQLTHPDPVAQPQRQQVAQPAPATQPRPVTQATDPAGWSRAGGSEITVREGETVYNLSRRFGVPADAILRANGMQSADALQAGQRIVIPAYNYSGTARVSAPDSDRNTANADAGPPVTPQGQAPRQVPAPVPAQDNVAVLPTAPKPKEPQAAPRDSAPAATASGASGTYVVQQGDSLYVIARKTGSSVEALKAANGLKDAGLIRVGQTLTVPAPGATIAAATPPPALDRTSTGTVAAPKPAAPAATPAPAAQQPTQAAVRKPIEEAVEADASVAPGGTGVGKMRWPVHGRVISQFGSGSGAAADGIDIAVPEGSSVRAAENGVVIYAGDGLKDFGNTVLVRHENGLVTVYGHNSQITVSRGDTVRRGQEIARSGMSGKAEMPKLHFEVRKDSSPVNPANYLE